MRLRYSGQCRLCGAQLATGVEAIYERDRKTVRCTACNSEATASHPGTAGSSARREYLRRKEKREERIRSDHPKIGGLILALTDDPQSTKAWERGAVGEERLGEHLTHLPETFRILHDRRIPRTRTNIDHIAVGPSGVWVIDAKRYVNKRPALHVEGGLFRPRVESLRINGRDQTKLVQGVRSQVDRVETALTGSAVPVIGVLCFLDADWPLVGGSFSVNGTQVLWPKLLIKRMIEAAPSASEVDQTYEQLARAFPSA